MNILNSIIRTYFIDFALDVATEAIVKNFSIPPPPARSRFPFNLAALRFNFLSVDVVARPRKIKAEFTLEAISDLERLQDAAAIRGYQGSHDDMEQVIYAPYIPMYETRTAHG